MDMYHNPNGTFYFKNLLVAYHGGGYDGCFWEWNYFSYDKYGKFHNILTTGRNGIKTESEAMNTVLNPVDGTHVYDLMDPAQVNDFQENHNDGQVVAIVEALNTDKYGEYDGDIYFECQKCHEKVDHGPFDPISIGGQLTVQTERRLCEDCYYTVQCSYCGEDDDDCDKHDGLCDYCWGKKIKYILSSFSDEDVRILSYDPATNQYQTEEPDLSDITFDYYLVQADLRGEFHYRYYIVDAASEKEAMNDVDNFLSHKALLKAWTLREGLEEIGKWVDDMNFREAA